MSIQPLLHLGLRPASQERIHVLELGVLLEPKVGKVIDSRGEPVYMALLGPCCQNTFSVFVFISMAMGCSQPLSEKLQISQGSDFYRDFSLFHRLESKGQ